MPISLSSLRAPRSAPIDAVNGSGPGAGRDSGALQGGARERNMPRAVLGVALVGVCALAAGYLRVTSSVNDQVLRVTTRVAAGEVIAASDLSAVAVSAGSGSGLIPVSEESLVVGRSAAVTLVAGGFLTSGQLGPAGLASGQAEVEVEVKFGAYPADLAPGARVAVSSATSSSSSTGSAGVVPLSGDPQATVVAVSPSSSGDGSAGVELTATSQAAASINAIAAGQAVLAVVSASGE
jgi:hypothetical protein